METLGELLSSSRRAVFFTGAGISTESGIPDFRSPGGIWTRYDPREFTFDRYVASAEVRGKAWAMRREMLAAAPQPNAGHRAVARLEEAGRALGVVTQNIDGLHQAAGSGAVVELHGTAREVMCIGTAPRGNAPEGCGWRAETAWAFARVDGGDPDPRCPECGGLVKSATISFGQAMDPSSLSAAEALLGEADAIVVVGSSLQVYPAAALPMTAAENGIPLAIVNRDPTDLDSFATVVDHGPAGSVLSRAVEQAVEQALG